MRNLILIILILFYQYVNAQSLTEANKLFYYGFETKANNMIDQLASSNKVQDLVQAANYFQKTGNDTKAKQLYAKAETIEMGSLWNMLAAGKALLEKKDTEGAEKIFQKIVSKSKNKDAAIIAAIGESYLGGAGKNLNKATEYLQNSTAIDNSNMFTYITLGEAYMAAANGGKAMTQFEYAAEKDKTSPIPPYKIGDLYNKARNYKLGMESIKKANTLDENFAPALGILGDFYKKKQDFQKAKEIYGKYVELVGKNEDNMLKYINILFFAKDYAGANAIVDELRAKDPNNPELLRVLAYGNYEMGKYTEGQKQLEEFIEKSNESKINSDDYEYLAKFYRKSGNNLRAAESFKKSFVLDSTKSDLIDSSAVLYYAAKDYKTANELYLLKTTLKETNAQDWSNVGDTYLKMNDYSNADKAFTKVCEMKPSITFGYKMRGRVTNAMEQAKTLPLGSALVHYNKVLEIGNADPAKNKASILEANRYLATYYFNSGDLINAKNAVDSILSIDASDSVAAQILPHLK
jgi:tetratricopeptide (TPR) repeat protein